MNLWFVVSVANRGEVARVLAQIEQATGLRCLHCPMEAEYWVGLQFDLEGVPVP